MHPDKVVAATRVILDSLRQSITTNPEVRDAAGVLAQWLTETVSWAPQGASSNGSAPAAGPRGYQPGAAPMDRGRPPADLGLVIRRTRLKAEACRWALERQLMIDRGADRDSEIRPVDAGFLDRARELRGCWLWMFDPYGKSPEPANVERLIGCYEALATAIETVEELTAARETDPVALRDMYYLLAESQSMLWAGLRESGIDRDQDQTDAFIWLREKTREHRVFVERHMRREDPANPAEHAALQERLDAFSKAWHDALDGDREREALLNRLGYHVSRISDNITEEPVHDWQRVSEIIDELASTGHDPQEPEIAAVLAPLPDEIPDVELCAAAEAALNIE